MLEHLRHFFSGWVTVSTDSVCRSALAGLLWEAEIPFWHEKTAAGKVTVRIPWKDCPLFEETAVSAGLCFEIDAKGGLPVVLAFCRSRPGIPIGMILLLIWCLYSQNLIWRIEIEGCQNLPEAEVEAILTEAGCGVGDFVPLIDFDALHANLKAENPDIAWISVYMNGTTAEVQLRETRHGTDLSHPPEIKANVTASEAGEIVSVNVFEGQAVVKTGDVVLPGELLISGVVPMKTDEESRTEYAAGEVYAIVACPVSVEVSLQKKTKVYTGREKTKKSVKIFKKSINLFANTGIPYATYDTIDKMEEVCLPGGYPLPVVLYSTVYREYEIIEETRTPEEAAAEAMKQLREKTEEAIGTGEMLSRTVTTAVNEDGTYRIDCLLYILRDIASTAEFTVRPGEDQPQKMSRQTQ